MVALQLRFDAAPEPSLDLAFARARRIELGEGAWIEHVHGWVRGAESLFETLAANMAWRADERRMYERIVAVPRLRARYPRDGAGHPVLDAMAAALGPRYGATFDAITMALYRNGDDSVAWHRDRDHRDRLTSVVAVASLGGPRRFTVRPLVRESGARSIAFSIESGDLVVMGGTCQRTVEHAVPKLREAPARIALMFRHTEPISPLAP
jgi:alkylated DNA repair dioxygenase AlkB